MVSWQVWGTDIRGLYFCIFNQFGFYIQFKAFSTEIFILEINVSWKVLSWKAKLYFATRFAQSLWKMDEIFIKSMSSSGLIGLFVGYIYSFL